MIDVIFMLTIFFMLVSRFSSKENIPMDLPEPVMSQAKNVKIPERLVLNCRLADPGAGKKSSVLYSLGPNIPESLDSISNRLASKKLENPNIKVVIRADKRLAYEDVRAVMRVVAANDIEMLNVAAHTDERNDP